MKTLIALVAVLSLSGCANLSDMTFEERQIMGANLFNAGQALIRSSQPRGPDMTCYNNGGGQYSCYR